MTKHSKLSSRRDDGSVTCSSRTTAVAFIALILMAAALRLLHWPAVHELRDGDELGYSWGSLQLLEGNLPPIHYAPAGPQTWGGWACAGAISVKHLVFPDGIEAQAPRQLRPFLAVDHTLFDAYRDVGPLRQVWILMSFGCALLGVMAAFRLGLAKAGLPGAVFMGGTIALLPLFVEFSVQARPYIAGWSFGIIALYFVFASRNPQAIALSALFMGLAIGSRIDMAILLPVIWSAMWIPGQWKKSLGQFTRYHLVLLISFLITAPWYLMTLLAGLRAIGTIRGSTAGLVVTAPMIVFRKALWEQGMLLHLPLFVAAIVLWILQRPRHWLLAIYSLLVGISIFRGAAFGFRYQGAPLIIAVFAGLYAIEFVRRYSARFAVGLSVAALIFPAMQTVRMIIDSKRNYVPESATQWVEQHVPPGTIIYIRPWISNLLPTPAAADAGWAEVTDTTAYRRKFQSGLQRFSLNAQGIPRALSEVNLALERGNRRFMFILGGHHQIAAPRFDTRIFESGPVFGVRDLPAVFKQTGGVIILRSSADEPLIQALGPTTIEWINSSAAGTRIYCSSDVASKLR